MSIPANNSGSRGIVITTINPKGCKEHQSRCLKAWKDLGLRVVSFNSSKESGAVSGLYGSVAEVVELVDEATALSIHGKPAPRIRPVLQLALDQLKPEYVFLTNSDIYPSFRKAPLGIFCEYPAYAFTRKEVISIASGERCRKMYRGGLDIFAFNATALAAICGFMEEESCADQMAFGVPGWDYFMGATVSRPEIGGIIADGTRFWHKAHRTTYSQIDQFSVFVPYLVKLGFVRSRECAPAAAEFAAHIDRQCRVHAGCSSMMELIYGNFESGGPPALWADGLEEVYDIIGNDPLLHTCQDYIAELDCYLADPQMNIEGLQTYLLSSESPAGRFKELLVMIYLTLLVRGARVRRTPRTRYPAGNARMAVIRHILGHGSFYIRRCQLAELFFSEYFIYDILNRNDLKALALSCMNDAERSILRKIILFINHDSVH